VKLFHCTITGADHSIDPKQILELSKEFPFVEWGILFSPSKEGKDRYPPLNWVCQLVEQSLSSTNLSAHLCGKYSRDLILKHTLWLPLNGHIFKRIQINCTQEDTSLANLEMLSQQLSMRGQREFIFQYRGGQTPLGLREAELISKIPPYNQKQNTFGILYDKSGGKGVLSGTWPTLFSGMRCGYAGGLNPDNLQEQLTFIAEAAGESEVWIDMETGVRTDNKFDLIKVRRCLEIASTFRS